MYGYINGIDFINLEAEKFWSFPKSYKGDSKAEAKFMVTSGEYIGAAKKDGHFYRFIKDEDGNCILQGRSKNTKGEYVNKIEWLPHLATTLKELPNGTCLHGEVYFPNNEGSRNVTTIMGCLLNKALNKQSAGTPLSYYIFDVWAYSGVDFLSTIIEERIKTLRENINPFVISNSYIEIAKYYDGENLWKVLQNILSSGGEGIVITRKGTTPSPAKRTARKTLKIKKEIANTIDCFFTGKYKQATELYTGKNVENWTYWKNLKTGALIEKNLYNEYVKGEPISPVTRSYFNGWAGSVELAVYKNGVITPIGWVSGLTDEIKQGIVTNNADYINKVCSVTCMELEKIGDKTSMRHPKFVEFRNDKNWQDCEGNEF